MNNKNKNLMLSYVSNGKIPVAVFDRNRILIRIKNIGNEGTYGFYRLPHGIDNNSIEKFVYSKNKDLFKILLKKEELLEIINKNKVDVKDFFIEMIFYFNDKRLLEYNIDENNEKEMFDILGIEKEINLNGLKFSASICGFESYKYYLYIGLLDYIKYVESLQN